VTNGLLHKDIATGCSFILRLMASLSAEASDAQLNENTSSEGLKGVVLGCTEVHSLLEAALADYCGKRSSNISHLFLHELLERQPTILWPLTDRMSDDIVSPDVRVFCKTQVCSMLSSMISKKTISEIGESDWRLFCRQIVPKICQVVMLVDCDQVKAKYLQELLALLSRILSSDPSKESIQELIVEGFTEKLFSLKSVNKEIKKLVNNICHTLSSQRSQYSVLGSEGKGNKEKKRKRKDSSSSSTKNGIENDTVAPLHPLSDLASAPVSCSAVSDGVIRVITPKIKRKKLSNNNDDNSLDLN